MSFPPNYKRPPREPCGEAALAEPRPPILWHPEYRSLVRTAAGNLLFGFLEDEFKGQPSGSILNRSYAYWRLYGSMDNRDFLSAFVQFGFQYRHWFQYHTQQIAGREFIHPKYGHALMYAMVKVTPPGPKPTAPIAHMMVRNDLLISMRLKKHAGGDLDDMTAPTVPEVSARRAAQLAASILARRLKANPRPLAARPRDR